MKREFYFKIYKERCECSFLFLKEVAYKILRKSGEKFKIAEYCQNCDKKIKININKVF